MARPSLADLHAALASSSADASAAALGRLRAALRVHADDLGEYATAHVAVTDERLLLAREVVEGTPRVLPLVFDAWELSEQRTLPTLRPVPMQVLAQVLELLSAHQPYHALGDEVVAALLAPGAPWLARLQAYVAGAAHARREKREATHDTVAALVALKLLTAMATFARGKHAAAVWERFHWTSELHARLLSMRRRARGGAPAVRLADADLRTQYLLFLGAMLTQAYSAPLKGALLDLGAEGLPLALRGLVADPAEVVQYVLLVLHEEVFKDTHVARGAKAKLFTEPAWAALLRLYTREDDALGARTSVADLVHHFLLSIATHPGFGVCYADRGWYPRADDEGHGGVHNKVLAQLLRQLAPVDDLRQQELALRILRACPELGAAYLAAAPRTLTLEPRADSAWLGSMAFLARVLALPPPLATAPPAPPAPTPPPLATVLANTAPEALLRALARGVRHADALVQYTACLVVARALQRIAAVARAATHAADALEEPPEGAWRTARHALERAWRARLPPPDAVAPLAADAGLRQEAALRVLALYHAALPSAAFDARFDPARLLARAFLAPRTPAPLDLAGVCQLHALSLAARAPEAAYDLAARAPAAWPGLAARSNAHFLLALYAHAHGAVRARAAALLHTQLARTALFAHDASEIRAWLVALPRAGAALPSVLQFLDECVQRALKTPYRYAERARTLAAGARAGAEDAAPSALLVVAVEQASIRLARGLFDTGAGGTEANASAPIAAYLVRVLLVRLADAQPCAPLRALGAELTRAGSTHAATRAVLAAGAALLDAPLLAECDEEEVPWTAAARVLQSTPETYARLDTRAWRMLLVVLLERLDPAAASAAHVHAAFDALDAWAAAHELSPADLGTYVVRRAAVAAWLAHAPHGAAAAFRVRLVDWAAGLAQDRAEYAPVLAPLVDDAAHRLAHDASNAALLHAATRLAPTARDAAPVVRALLAGLPTAREPHAVLACLAAHAAASVRRRAAAPLAAVHDALPALAAHLPAPPAVRVLALALRAALPAGLDAAAPPTCGSLGALRRVQAHTLPCAALVRAPSADADAVLARCVYAHPGAAAAVRAAWRDDTCAALPHTTLALLEMRRAAHAPADAPPDAPPDAPLVAGVLGAVHAAAHAPLAPVWCVAAAALGTHAAARAPLLAALAAHLDAVPHAACTPALVWLVGALHDAPLAARLSAAALRTLVARLGAPHDTPAARSALRAYTALLLRGAPADAALAEPVLDAVAQARALDADALRLARALVRAAPPRAAAAAPRRTRARPTTRCARRSCRSSWRSAHVRPTRSRRRPRARVLYLYTGTLAAADRALLALLHTDAAARGTSLLDTLRAWSADAAPVPSTLARDSLRAALLSLDATSRGARGAPGDARAYDPWLVLNLVGGALLERAGAGTAGGAGAGADGAGSACLTGLEWLAVVRTGALGVVVAALSAHRAALRAFAQALLGKVYADVRAASFRERDLLLLVLERVRDALPPPPPTSITGTYDEVPWLPTMATLFAAHCLRAVAAPQLTLFPTLCRFLLQRPRLDVHDVPLLYNLLHTSSDQLHHERSWLLRFLDDAFAAHARLADARTPPARRRTRADWRVFQRRHVWDLLLSLYDALAPADHAADARDRARLESIFACAARVPYLATTLVTRRGFLHWIAMRTAAGARGTFWVQLLADVAGAHLARAPRLAHLETLDRALDGSLVLTALGAAADALDDIGTDAHTAGTLVHTLLEYAVLRGPGVYAASEARVATRILTALAPRIGGTSPAAADVLLTSVLYAAHLARARDTAAALRRLFAHHLGLAHHARTYAPRLWALSAVAAPPAP
ncbi:hypothetical protein MOBT1_001224 [Malassezia obtusa]|uniref:Nucleolar pre-ribosomal-associated protein 1 n=1 Tax=Malassezia obtusa TaxID=76774 RepID=A0AAF0IRF9_9BASI|nr:hypothetical protein MOBT1_001224 [Malassezia obtusa]